MVTGYWKSEEGVKAYSEIGESYPTNVLDPEYDKFKAITKNSPHNQRAKEVITKMTRVLADDGKEYLVYDCNEVGYDNLGNEREFFRGDLGMYPIPIARKELRMGPDMTQKEVVAEIIRHDVGYSMPFSSSNVDKLHKNADDKKQRGRTQYLIQRMNGQTRSVTNYDAFGKGEFIELEKFGMTLDQWKEQQKAITDLKKIAADAPPGEAEKAAESLTIAGEQVSGPTETTPERAKRKEEEGIIASEPEEEKDRRGSRPSNRR